MNLRVKDYKGLWRDIVKYLFFLIPKACTSPLQFSLSEFTTLKRWPLEALRNRTQQSLLHIKAFGFHSNGHKGTTRGNKPLRKRWNNLLPGDCLTILNVTMLEKL